MPTIRSGLRNWIDGDPIRGRGPMLDDQLAINQVPVPARGEYCARFIRRTVYISRRVSREDRVEHLTGTLYAVGQARLYGRDSRPRSGRRPRETMMLIVHVAGSSIPELVPVGQLVAFRAEPPL